MSSPTDAIRSPVGHVDLHELAALLIKNAGLHDGLFEVSVVFSTTIANFLSPGAGRPAGPGMLSTVTGGGLSFVTKATPLSVDAAQVNPAPQRRTSLKALVRKPKR